MGRFTQFRPGTPHDTFGSGAAGAAASAQLTGIAGRTGWITGFELSWAADGTGTVTDTLTIAPTASSFNSLTYKVTTVAGAGGHMAIAFPAPIACNAAATTISAALTAAAGRAAATIVLHGFYL